MIIKGLLDEKAGTVRKLALSLVEGYTLDSLGEKIQSLGKFEGEPAEILYWYACGLDGGEDESGYNGEAVDWSAFALEREEREAFGLASDISWAILHHSDAGFEHLEYSTGEEFEKFSDSYNAQFEEEEEE